MKKENDVLADIKNRMYEAGLYRENERIIFMERNCVILENFTGKRYSYRAVSMYDMRYKHLFACQNPIDESKYDQIKEKLYELEIGIVSDYVIEDIKKRADNLLVHIFRDILPGYGMNYRKEQLELSRAMLKALQENKLVLCEAGVGTGKTHAYIMAVTIYNLFSKLKISAVISTSTIALQKALTEEYIPQISAILIEQRIIDKPLTYVVRKGKSHYACDSRLTDYIMSLMHNNNSEDREVIALLSKLMTGSSSIDLDTIPVSDYVKERICVEQCHLHCGFSSTCQYRKYTRKCRICSYDFQIVNHNFILADTINLKNGKSRLLPEYGIAVFDEAHKIIEAAKQMYGVSLEEKELERLAVSIYRAAGNQYQKRKNIKQLCDDLDYQKQVLFQEISRRSGESYEDGSFTIKYTVKSISLLVQAAVQIRRLTSIINNVIIYVEGSEIVEQDLFR